MLTRRVALPLAALTALATMPVLIEAAPAGASGAVVQPSPASRGRSGHNGDRKAEEPQNNCPTTLWTVPLEIKGLACLLLLPKPEKQGQGGDGSGGGGGGLLG
jgi:hypothetical protein